MIAILPLIFAFPTALFLRGHGATWNASYTLVAIWAVLFPAFFLFGFLPLLLLSSWAAWSALCLALLLLRSDDDDDTSDDYFPRGPFSPPSEKPVFPKERSRVGPC